MLEIERLTRQFGVKAAVAGVSLQIEKGSFVGVIGRSGAGKSTLLRLINRLVEPTAGRIVFDGVDVTALRGRALRLWRARAAMVFQQFNLIGRLDVLTNVLIGRLALVPPWRSLAGWWPIRTKRLHSPRSNSSEWLSSRRSGPITCLAGNSNAWRSPVRSSRSPRSCLPTSRSPRSTRTILAS